MSWDARYWAKRDLVDFIKLYKSFPCLWKTKSKEYNNKQWKHHAYEQLVAMCRKKVNPEANRDFVTKKIQSMRGSFRKELRKVLESKASGVPERDVYKPNLWYFNLLLFTKNQEEGTDNSDNSDDVKIELDNADDDELDYDDVDEWPDSPVFISDTNIKPEESIIEMTKTEISDLQQTDAAVNTDSCCNPLHIGTKRKILDSNLQCMHVLENTNTDLNEFVAVGISVGKKLQRMDPIQAIYAEALINKVLSKGLLKNLSENTEVYEKVQFYGQSNLQTLNVSMTNSPSAAVSSSHSGYVPQFQLEPLEHFTQKEND